MLCRPDDGKYTVDDFDPSLCSHGLYAFATIDIGTWAAVSHDPWLDLGPGDGCGPNECVHDTWRSFTALKSQNAKFIPMLSIGKLKYNTKFS